jgi:hypothetical protein
MQFSLLQYVINKKEKSKDLFDWLYGKINNCTAQKKFFVCTKFYQEITAIAIAVERKKNEKTFSFISFIMHSWLDENFSLDFVMWTNPFKYVFIHSQTVYLNKLKHKQISGAKWKVFSSRKKIRMMRKMRKEGETFSSASHEN